MRDFSRTACGCWCAALAAGLVSLAAYGQSNSVQSLDYVQLDRHRGVIRIGFKHPLAQPPSGFRTFHPVARIVLEFPDTSVEPRKTIGVEQGLLRSISLVQQGTRTRLVVKLAGPAGFETALDGNLLLITVHAAARSAGREVKYFAPGGHARHQLRAVEFRRGAGGEAIVTAVLSAPWVGVEIRQQGRSLVADFADTEIPPEQRQRLDVLDFATPVGALATYAGGRSARLVIEPVARFDYSARQSGHEFIVTVAPVPQPVEPPARRY